LTSVGQTCGIEDYALIGDCRTAALVSRAGSIDWLCLPDFSSPAIFAGLLDPARGGSCSIQPQEAFAATRRYIGPTVVLETTFTTDSGVVRLLDLMPIGDGVRPMGPLREVLRVVECTQGTVDLEIRVDARPDYGQRSVRPRKRGRLGWIHAWRDEVIAVQADITLRPAGDALAGSARLAAGERRYLSIAYTKGDAAIFPALGGEADERILRTIAWWRDWAARCRYDGPWRDQVVRSVVTLKLLTYAPSGAIVAAPTTSLPEALGKGRNWDYRYCWLRDAGLINQALIALGYHDEARSFLAWLLHATRLTWPELQIMYDVFGRTRLEERELTHLAGYRGSPPVRIGNAAYTQRQLDVYGEVVTAADATIADGERLDRTAARMLTGLGTVVCKQWREPDSSIWEVRGPPRHYTFSKVMCWAALDGLLALQQRGALALTTARMAQFNQERAAIADAIERRGFNTSLGSYVSVLGGDRLDSSLMLMACIGYKDAGDPRMRTTYEQIQQRLGRHGLLYRYERDGLPVDGVEGAFGICGFWAIDNLAKRGDLDEAERSFDHMLSFANDVGLYAEEIDARSGAPLGNFPQAFTHVGLINAAVAIAAGRRRGRA
jgi:GH15 family glucan-1,4-alpha-glucosidase